MGALQRVRGWFGGAASAGLPTPSAGYLRGEPGSPVSIHMPSPALRDRSEDIRAQWRQVNGRANDAILNNGWIAGVVDQIVSLMVGTELRLNAKPEMTAFGFDQEQTAAWARMVERRYRVWSSQAYECDAGGRYTMGQMQAAAARQWLATGEIVADIPFIARPGAETVTKMRLIPSHWLSQRSDPLGRMMQGVRLDRHGMATGYLFEARDPRTGLVYAERRARDQFGRPEIVHIFDGVAGQVRGISPLAPALKVTRQFDQLADATLTAAMLHAVFAATIESDYPTEEVMAALQGEGEAADDLSGAFDAFVAQKLGWNKNINIDLGQHGKVAHLMTGERLKLHGAEHPNSSFEAFANFLLREIAACLGVMFEDVTGDYRGATYSSIRMGIAKKWPLMEYRRRNIVGRFAQTGYEAWLEEEIDTGRIPLPGGIDAFVANRSSLCRSDWRGPPKPQADDVKAAKAHREWYDLGVMTQEDICNDLGRDHEDVQEQLAREKANRRRLGIADPVPRTGGAPTQMDVIDEGEADDAAGGSAPEGGA